jgi:hypothetical protein
MKMIVSLTPHLLLLSLLAPPSPSHAEAPPFTWLCPWDSNIARTLFLLLLLLASFLYTYSTCRGVFASDRLDYVYNTVGFDLI